ncbi:hypothetical protein [Mesorhizobium sp.]|uniref:hypothetical protein n=1 Tax=Mesorhizobium sp. TaxID=1871066 RepID=UPI00258BB578|nr:hypothetical protein [Mesorhizobium sp.]
MFAVECEAVEHGAPGPADHIKRRHNREHRRRKHPLDVRWNRIIGRPRKGDDLLLIDTENADFRLAVNPIESPRHEQSPP